MSKRKPLTATQLDNLKSTINKLEVPMELEYLFLDIKKYLQGKPVYESFMYHQGVLDLLNRFVRIMEKRK